MYVNFISCLAVNLNCGNRKLISIMLVIVLHLETVILYVLTNVKR